MNKEEKLVTTLVDQLDAFNEVLGERDVKNFIDVILRVFEEVYFGPVGSTDAVNAAAEKYRSFIMKLYNVDREWVTDYTNGLM